MTILIKLQESYAAAAADLANKLIADFGQDQVWVHPWCEQLDRVTLIVMDQLSAGELNQYPRLQCVQRYGIGVEQLLRPGVVPDSVHIARLRTPSIIKQVTEYVLAHVLSWHRLLHRYRDLQENRVWLPIEPPTTELTTVGVLGTGDIGSRLLSLFSLLGFHCMGWSKSPKHIPNAECLTGEHGLRRVLETANVVVCCLPSTPLTRNLLTAERMAQIKDGAFLINVGRGDLVEANTLLDALNSGKLEAAVLDVFDDEPLPTDHPFWKHKKIVITPHIACWSIPDAAPLVADTYRRIREGLAPMDSVDREQGY